MRSATAAGLDRVRCQLKLMLPRFTGSRIAAIMPTINAQVTASLNRFMRIADWPQRREQAQAVCQSVRPASCIAGWQAASAGSLAISRSGRRCHAMNIGR
ncbi:hypothetical protein [Klebsiella pneumoniae]